MADPRVALMVGQMASQKYSSRDGWKGFKMADKKDS